MKEKAKIFEILYNENLTTEDVIKAIQELHTADPNALAVVKASLGSALHLLVSTPDDPVNYKYDKFVVAQEIIRLAPETLESRWNDKDLPIEWAARHGDVAMLKLFMPHYQNLKSLVVDDRHVEHVKVKATSLVEYAISIKN